MDTIVQRLKKYLDFIDVSVSIAEKKINISNGSLSKPFNANTTIKTDTLEKFLKYYPEINPEWLLTGHGDMLKSGVSQPPEIAVSGGLMQEKITFLQEKIVLLQENGVLKDKVIALNDKVIDGLEFKVATLVKELVNDSSTADLAPVKSRTLAGV